VAQRKTAFSASIAKNKPPKDQPNTRVVARSLMFSRHPALLIWRVVVGLLNSESSQQNHANENKHGAYRQHIEIQGKVIGLDDPKHSNLPSGRRELCGCLSEFDKQLFFMTALIAFERAPIGA
jgi:hypothetical protein